MIGRSIRKRSISPVGTSVAVWALSVGALAPRAEAADAGKPDVQHRFSLTVSPLHLALPVLEVTGEYRLHDQLGIAGILGAGKVSDSKVDLEATAIEVGGQVRYYVLGSFIHGMQLGAEVLYLHLGDDRLDVAGSGLAVGPFVGYKIAANIGFTFDAQLGFQRILVEAHDDTTSKSDDAWGVLLNLNVGWSF